MKKKWVSISACIVVVLLLCAAYLIYHNYRLGQELYAAVSTMSVQTQSLADSIEYLEKEFDKADGIQNVNRQSYDYAILGLYSSFGYEDMPLLDDVRMAWITRLEELQQKTLGDVEVLGRHFTEESDEMTELKKKLENMTDCFIRFNENYNKMSVWQRCFTSWKNERRMLSDMVGLP